MWMWAVGQLIECDVVYAFRVWVSLLFFITKSMLLTDLHKICSMAYEMSLKGT